MIRRNGDFPPRSRLARLAVGATARLHFEWALRRPAAVPWGMVVDFPRSGANWVRDMLGDALQLPVPRFPRLPVTHPALLHNHDHRPLRGVPAAYVVRDGRDVFLSHFDKAATTYAKAPPAARRRAAQLHPSLRALDRRGDFGDVDLLEFYGEWARRPLGSRAVWGRHVSGWIRAAAPSTVVVRYEDMLARPEETLAAAAARLAGRDLPPWVVEFAVRRNSFEAQTGRRPGEVDRTSTKRRGTAGAWRTELPPEIQARFLADFAEALALAGYET